MHQHSGSSFIEILISLTLLSLILLSLDAMQLTALREAKSSYYFSVAIEQLNNMIERLKIIKSNQIHKEVLRWNQQNVMALPQGKGNVRGTYPNFILNIFWGKTKEIDCDKNKIRQTGCLQWLVKL